MRRTNLLKTIAITATMLFMITGCNKVSAPIETLPMGPETPVETSGEGVTESDTEASTSGSVSNNTKGNSESTSSKKDNSTSSSSKNDKTSTETIASTKVDSTTVSTKSNEVTESDSHTQASAAPNETTTQAESTSQTVTEKNTETSTESTTKAIEVSETTTESTSQAPTENVTQAQTEAPTQKPTENVTQPSTEAPTTQPETTTQAPTEAPTQAPTEAPTPALHVHSYISTVTKAATCAEEGVITYTCSCGDSYTESISMTAHSFGNYIYNYDATTEADGTKTAVCSVCGVTDTVTAEGTKKSLPSWYDEHSQQLNVATGAQDDGSLEMYFTNGDWTGASLGCWDFGYNNPVETIGEYAEGWVHHGWLSKD